MKNWTIQDMPPQNGRVVLITGANSGIGFEMALAFAQKGARVVLACRNLEKGQDACESILSQISDAALDLRRLDLSSLKSVRGFAESVVDEYGHLDVLLNNAGLMAVPRWETADSFEMQLGVNHLGHFALTGLLLPLLIQTPHSRVVTISSMFSFIGKIDFEDLQSEQRYTRYGAYGQSKLANILFAFELQRQFEQSGIMSKSLSAHPGYSVTNLQSNSVQSSESIGERILYGLLNDVIAQSSEMGALPALYAAVSPEVRPGAFYGPRYAYFRGYPEAQKPPKQALDEADAGHLWRISEQLTGVSYQFSSETAAKQTG